MMSEICFRCGCEVTHFEIKSGMATKTIHGLYAHPGCIASHRKDDTMDDQTQHILGAADSAHQSIELAISLLQESLGNMGEILTAGCEELGPASLGSTMRLGQCIKEARFILGDILQESHGLCVLLGRDLEVCEDDPVTLGDLVEDPRVARGILAHFSPLSGDDPEPGEDEYDDDDQPF